MSIVPYDYSSSWTSYGHLYDYFVGSSRLYRVNIGILMVTSQYRFSVAGSAAVVYDWGERNKCSTEGPLICIHYLSINIRARGKVMP
jgi:hypothetical protein